MANIELGPGQTLPGRSVGGTSFSSSLKGATMKNKSMQKQYRSKLQYLMNGYLLQCCRHWKLLTFAEKENWRVFSITYPQFQRYGTAEYLNAYNLFCKRNFYLFISLGSAFTWMVAPALIEYFEETPTFEVNTGTGILNLVMSFDLNDGNQDCIIFVSPTASKGRKFVDHSWRLMVITTNVNKSVDITQEYILKYAKIPVAGQNLFVSTVFCGIDNGQFWFHRNEVVTVIDTPEPPTQFILTVVNGTIWGPYILTTGNATII